MSLGRDQTLAGLKRSGYKAVAQQMHLEGSMTCAGFVSRKQAPVVRGDRLAVLLTTMRSSDVDVEQLLDLLKDMAQAQVGLSMFCYARGQSVGIRRNAFARVEARCSANWRGVHRNGRN